MNLNNLNIKHIDIFKRVVVTLDGRTSKIVTLYDEWGEEIVKGDDAHEAFSAVAKHPDGYWLNIDLKGIELAKVN